MATSITVTDNIVTGRHSGSSIPSGNIETDAAMNATLKALNQEARSTNSPSRIRWNDGNPDLEPDLRPVVTIFISNVLADGLVQVDLQQPVVMRLENEDTNFGDEVVIEFFRGRRFLFNFNNGSAQKNFDMPGSGFFDMRSGLTVLVLNEFELDVVE